MRNNKGEVQFDLDKIVPRPMVSAIQTHDGRIVVLRPKIISPFWRRFLPKCWREAVFRIKLDPIGSAVWQKIDGLKNAGKIATELQQEFGPKIHPVEQRLSQFLTMLHEANLIEFFNE
jgi:hypothetical protein